MNDQEDNPLQKIADELKHVGLPNSPKLVRDIPWPEKRLQSVGGGGVGGGAGPTGHLGPQSTVIKPSDLPRAGELSSQMFNDLSDKIINEMKETVESQLNDAANRRQHSLAQMDSLRAELDNVFSSFEIDVKKHQERVKMISAAIQQKVEDDTKEMLALSQRLKTFAENIDTAHNKFFATAPREDGDKA